MEHCYPEEGSLATGLWDCQFLQNGNHLPNIFTVNMEAPVSSIRY
jgi:hypothetical protein